MLNTDYYMDRPGLLDFSKRGTFDAQARWIPVEAGTEVVSPALNADFGVVVNWAHGRLLVTVYDQGEDCGDMWLPANTQVHLREM